MNIQPLVEKIAREVERHAIPGRPGAYRRYLTGDANPYGCADAANIWYTLGIFPRDLDFRAACVAELRKFQDPETGLFSEPTHHTYHTTAHCAAALELFDARPLFPLAALDRFRTPAGITEMLETLDWHQHYGHIAAGIFAALLVTGHRDPAWQDAYFGWLAGHCDPETGLSVPGVIGRPLSKIMHMVNWFHMLFNFLACNRPIPRPEALIDSCIDIIRSADFPREFNIGLGFGEIDWCFCMNRASRLTDHRFAEVRELLRRERGLLLDYLTSSPEIADLHCGSDLHSLFGTVCALAELQLALPGEMETDIALRNVLDRRPFI